MPYRRDPDLIRRHIKEAAVRLFAQKGYAATTTREIADEAGVAKPALYYYFPDKEGLYVAIVRDALDSLAAALDQTIAEWAPQPVEALRRLVRAYLEFFAANRNVAIICFQEVFGLGENQMAEVAPWYFERIRSQVDQLVAAGPKGPGLSPRETEYISLSLLGIPNIFVLRYLLHGGDFDIEVVVTRVIDYYLAEAGDPQGEVTDVAT